ncbi:MAG TPA: hypothetical protein VD902_09110 [Symbiobacteriaceae bacterium]|nr:hypothetical protein [Symbiobacteriaceae bacterium]
MRTKSQLAVQGGTAHALSGQQMAAFQRIIAELGADRFPLFLRLGATERLRVQPVTARSLLAELESFIPDLSEVDVPGLSFRDGSGAELGRMYSRGLSEALVRGSDAAYGPMPEGIRVVVKGFPPPPGFRSGPGLEPLHYECYFRELRVTTGDWQGVRTAEMGGSDMPVPLPQLPVPPVTQWDVARVAGRPAVAVIAFTRTPANEVYRDLIHAFTSACNESLRLKAPLEYRRD